MALGGEWRTVPAVFEMFEGLDARTWLAAVRHLRAAQRTHRPFDEAIVFHAIRDIGAMNSSALQRVGLIVDHWSEERLKPEEDRLLVGLQVAAARPAASTAPDAWGIAIPTGTPVGQVSGPGPRLIDVSPASASPGEPADDASASNTEQPAPPPDRDDEWTMEE